MSNTEGLLLRQWTENDFTPFAKLCADKEVMEFFPNPLTKEESFELGNKAFSFIDEHGWGPWAVELSKQKCFIAFSKSHLATFLTKIIRAQFLKLCFYSYRI